MSLEKLSDDLLLEIVSWVEAKDFIPGTHELTTYRTRFLGPLALCSRRLNVIASPLLYRTFVQTAEKGLPIFLRLILNKPGIRSEVKVFIGSECDPDYPLDMSAFSDHDFERCRLAMNSFGDIPIEKDPWLSVLKKGSWDAIVALLFFLLPALEEIEMEAYSGNVEYIPQVLSHMARQQSINNSTSWLKHLKKTKIAWHDTEYGMCIQDVEPFCALPSIEDVQMHMMADEEPERSSHRYHVKNLHIGYSCIDGEAMISILQRFPVLQTFSYENGGATVGYSDFLPQKFGEAIAHLYDCLEKFTLVDFDGGSIESEDAAAIGSLTKFKKLRSLFIDYHGLFGPKREVDEDEKPRLVDILPASIEELGIYASRPSVMDRLREFLNEKHERFQLLKLIQVDGLKKRKIFGGEIHWVGDGLEFEDDLCKDFQDSGIRLVIRCS